MALVKESFPDDVDDVAVFVPLTSPSVLIFIVSKLKFAPSFCFLKRSVTIFVWASARGLALVPTRMVLSIEASQLMFLLLV